MNIANLTAVRNDIADNPAGFNMYDYNNCIAARAVTLSGEDPRRCTAPWDDAREWLELSEADAIHLFGAGWSKTLMSAITIHETVAFLDKVIARGSLRVASHERAGG